MSFNPDNLDIAVECKVFNAYHYRTTDDAPAQILDGGYFDAAANRLRKFDLIQVVSETRTGEPEAFTALVVAVSKTATGDRVATRRV